MISKTLAVAIVKGQVSDYALTVARLQKVTKAELAKVLREVASELDGDEQETKE